MILINVSEMCFIPINVWLMNCSIWCSSPQMETHFACSFNIFYIYQAFIILFHKALPRPFLDLSLTLFLSTPLSLSLSLSPSFPLFLSICLSLSLAVVPHPVFLMSGLSLQFGDAMFSSCNPEFFAVRYIHYPVNPPSDNVHTDALIMSPQHHTVHD